MLTLRRGTAEIWKKKSTAENRGDLDQKGKFLGSKFSKNLEFIKSRRLNLAF